MVTERAASVADFAEVATLDGVGQGTTLAGRYRLEERLHAGNRTSLWRALDTTLDRPVGVRIVAGEADQTSDTVDAARRASLVEDPRLLRVLDVGTSGPQDDGSAGAPVTYVVSEYVDGESLATRLARGPMRASLVRAVVGEAAEALERARIAGLHHERLTPASVVLTREDDVKVVGLGVDATLAGNGSTDAGGDAAARCDAVALVALLYAGLTGRWPFGEVEGLPAAPEVSGLPAAPADLVPGVPGDLDTLCAVTLGPHDDGPRTPGELADELAPWGLAAASRAGRARDEEPRGLRPAGRFPVRLGSGTAAGAVGAGVAAAVSAAGLRPDRSDTPGAPASAGTPRERWEELATTPPDAGHDERPAAGTRPGNQSRIVLAVLGALVVIGLVLAVSSLSNLGEGVFGDPQAGATQNAPPATEPAPPPIYEQPAPPAVEAPTIQGVRTLDPQGDDGAENDESAPAAIDGDPATAWESSTYNTAEFGNLKDGVGMIVDLGRPSTLSGVQLAVDGSGGTVEIRTSGDPTLDASTVVATAQITGEPVDVTLPQPVQTQYVILWFTLLPETDDGYRVELAQVQVR